MRSLDVVGHVPGLTYRQLHYWITCGLIRPSTPSIGSGYPLDIPEAEVAVLRVMVPLVHEGLTPTRAAEIARALIADGSASLGGLVLVRAAS